MTTLNRHHHRQNGKLDEIEYIHCPFLGCKKVFLYKSEVERHLITHDNSKPLTCPYEFCEKRFKRQDALRVHIQSHSEEPQFVCSVPGCQAKYKSKPALKYHLSKHHISELKSISNSSLEDQKTSHLKIKSKEPLEKGRDLQQKSFDPFSEECEEEIEPKPTKFLFQEGGETRSNSSQSSVNQKISKKGDEELRELMFLYRHLIRENRELKRQLADQMLSTE